MAEGWGAIATSKEPLLLQSRNLKARLLLKLAAILLQISNSIYGNANTWYSWSLWSAEWNTLSRIINPCNMQWLHAASSSMSNEMQCKMYAVCDLRLRASVNCMKVRYTVSMLDHQDQVHIEEPISACQPPHDRLPWVAMAFICNQNGSEQALSQAPKVNSTINALLHTPWLYSCQDFRDYSFKTIRILSRCASWWDHAWQSEGASAHNTIWPLAIIRPRSYRVKNIIHGTKDYKAMGRPGKADDMLPLQVQQEDHQGKCRRHSRRQVCKAAISMRIFSQWKWVTELFCLNSCFVSRWTHLPARRMRQHGSFGTQLQALTKRHN